jgi:hypothetical protein
VNTAQSTLFCAALLSIAGRAAAIPRAGELFPAVGAKDLTGQDHRTEEYAGARTLVVSISDRDAGDAMRAWFHAADARIAKSVARRSIISLHLPFVVTTNFARSQAREQVPEAYWHDTLLDRGDMAAELGEAVSPVPYVYALDEHRRVLAVAHALMDAPEAQTIWAALHTGEAPGP